jgi:transcriptional regulator with XRE-family HTH domain
LVEQRIENPRVGGSIPPQATKVFNEKAQLSRVGLFRFWVVSALCTHGSGAFWHADRDCKLDALTARGKMSAIAVSKVFETEIAAMKRNEHPLMTPERLDEARQLGEKLARLRMARRIRQADAATRAGLSRSTAVLLEKGDLGRTQAQILRYLEAIAPGVSLLSLLREDDPSLQALAARETTQRVRTLSKTELERLDF